MATQGKQETWDRCPECGFTSHGVTIDELKGLERGARTKLARLYHKKEEQLRLAGLAPYEIAEELFGQLEARERELLMLRDGVGGNPSMTVEQVSIVLEAEHIGSCPKCGYLVGEKVLEATRQSTKYVVEEKIRRRRQKKARSKPLPEVEPLLSFKTGDPQLDAVLKVMAKAKAYGLPHYNELALHHLLTKAHAEPNLRSFQSGYFRQPSQFSMSFSGVRNQWPSILLLLVSIGVSIVAWRMGVLPWQ